MLHSGRIAITPRSVTYSATPPSSATPQRPLISRHGAVLTLGSVCHVHLNSCVFFSLCSPLPFHYPASFTFAPGLRFIISVRTRKDRYSNSSQRGQVDIYQAFECLVAASEPHHFPHNILGPFNRVSTSIRGSFADLCTIVHELCSSAINFACVLLNALSLAGLDLS